MKQFLLTIGLMFSIWAVPQIAQAQTLQVSLSGPDSVCLFSNNWAFYTANTSGGAGGYFYSWNLPTGGSTPGNGTWINWANLNAGTYSVSVCVSDSLNNFACDTLQVTTSTLNCPPMQVQMGWWPDTPCVGRPVQFWDSVMNSSYQNTVSWDFGDGNTSNQQWGATHTYTQAGTYTVQLCVFDSIRNDTVCVSQQLTVNANCPQISASVNGPDTLCIGAPNGTFQASVTGSPNGQLSYRWSIETSTYFNNPVTHTFSNPGTYVVTLRVIDWSIQDTAFVYDTVVVEPGSACLQPLSVTITGQDSLCTYSNNWTNLTASVSGGTGLYTYRWNDSNGRTSTRVNHFVSSSTPGTVTVILDVMDSGLFAGSDTFYVTFSSTNCPPIQADFGFWPDTPCVGRAVQFWDSVMFASNSISTTWDFGDGSPIVNAGPWSGVTHTYTTAGTYTVTYCAYDSVRNDTSCASKQVIVNQNCPQVTATITGPDTLCIGSPIGAWTANVTSGSSRPQISYRWQIGPRTYFSQTANHIFTTPGTYGISLRIIDWSIPDTFYIQDTVVVEPGSACLQPLQVAIQGPDTVCMSNGSSTQLSALVSGGSGQYTYDWNDSRGGRSTRSTHFVWSNTPQTVTAWLDVIDSQGQFAGRDTFTVVFTYGGSCPPIQPQFGYWPIPPCAGQPVSFWDSTGVWGPNFSYSWDMGDGTTYSNNQFQFTHTYAQAGSYPVTFCVIDSANQDTVCVTDTLQVAARCWPIVSADSIFVMPDSVCPGQSITYFGSYSGGNNGNAFEYWDFGDGNQVSGSSATHAYSTGGNYTVQYCVVDSVYGDTSCISTSIHILNTCADTVSGYLYHDVNQDNVYNAGDAPLGGYPVTINPGGSMAFADAQGFYQMALAPGTYTVSAANIPNYGNTSPASGSYTHSLTGTFTNQQGDFGYDSLLTNHDLSVYLYCSTPRPGFSHWISVYFNNKGTNPVSGSIILSYDPQTTFQYTTPLNNGVHDAVNHTITWTFTNLPTGISNQRVRGWFQLPATVPLGNILNASVRIDPVAGDTDITNNLDACSRTVVGSYDPNDKTVNQPAEIQGDEWLTYTVRFQNTGTDTAFNVVVRDVIDQNLDLSTFQMLGSSHQYRLSIDHGREAVWVFDNILLADSNTNEPLSHGDILYRIKPKPSLSPGTTMRNTAAIYFDFNAPIITNTTVNSIAYPVAIDDELASAISGFKVFPNPAKSQVNVAFDNVDLSMHAIKLTAVDGKVLYKAETRGNSVQFDLNTLPSGLYMIHISNKRGERAYKKLLVE